MKYDEFQQLPESVAQVMIMMFNEAHAGGNT